MDSNENDIESAFKRVGLSTFSSGYFCFENVGFKKGSRKFLLTILSKTGVSAEYVTVVGDYYEKDIVPAVNAGINAIWLNKIKQTMTAEESK